MKNLIKQNIEETLKECNMDDKGLSQVLADLNLEDGLGFDGKFQNLSIDCETLDKLEYIRTTGEGQVKVKEDQWLDPEEDSGDDEDDYSWMEPLIKVDPERFQDETYFCAINYDRKPMKAGEQAFISYGCRTNYFLLQSYGFCFIDNLNESFKFYVKLDIVTAYKQK